jgi:hypothetical protein
MMSVEDLITEGPFPTVGLLPSATSAIRIKEEDRDPSRRPERLRTALGAGARPFSAAAWFQHAAGFGAWMVGCLKGKLWHLRPARRI